MLTQVLIHPKSIERGRIKTREEHIHHNEHIQLAFLHAFGHIFVVVGKLVSRIKIAGEHRIVVRYRIIQKIAVGLVELRRTLAVFLQQQSIRLRIIIIHAVTVDQRYLQPLFLGQRCLLTFELRIVEPCRLNRSCSKN